MTVEIMEYEKKAYSFRISAYGKTQKAFKNVKQSIYGKKKL